MFSSVSVWAQGNNNPVRITISGIEGFNGWEGCILLSTSDDLGDGDSLVAYGEVDNITAGSATFSLLDEDDDPFTRAGRYYLFLVFENSVTERGFFSYNMHNITGGPQHIAFNFNAFFEIDLDDL